MGLRCVVLFYNNAILHHQYLRPHDGDIASALFDQDMKTALYYPADT